MATALLLTGSGSGTGPGSGGWIQVREAGFKVGRLDSDSGRRWELLKSSPEIEILVLNSELDNYQFDNLFIPLAILIVPAYSRLSRVARLRLAPSAPRWLRP